MLLCLQSAVLLMILPSVFGQEESNDCLSNKDCPSDEFCTEFRCMNPCLLNLCGDPMNCKVSNHIPVCACSPGFSGPLATGSCKKSGSKKYLTFRDKMNWFSALINCSAQGMTLATIENKEDQERLEKQVEKTFPDDGTWWNLWIGAADLHKEGEFVWIPTGKPLSYKNFKSGEPTNSGGKEHCLAAVGGNVWKYSWNDQPCDWNMEFACEYFQ